MWYDSVRQHCFALFLLWRCVYQSRIRPVALVPTCRGVILVRRGPQVAFPVASRFCLSSVTEGGRTHQER
jgi:hypothetical protein